jgi:hypothetical protein
METEIRPCAPNGLRPPVCNGTDNVVRQFPKRLIIRSERSVLFSFRFFRLEWGDISTHRNSPSPKNEDGYDSSRSACCHRDTSKLPGFHGCSSALRQTSTRRDHGRNELVAADCPWMTGNPDVIAGDSHSGSRLIGPSVINSG